jgi:hypothetical protein
MTAHDAMERAERAQAEREALEDALARDDAEAAALRTERAALAAALAAAARAHEAARENAVLPGSVVVCAALLGVLLTLVFCAAWSGLGVCR